MKIKTRQWDGREIGDLEVDAAPCGVPGLAVHAAVGAVGWVITHMPSWCRAAWFPDADPEYVLACARALGELGDWTTPFPGRRLTAKARVVIEDFGAATGQPRIPPAALRVELARIRSHRSVRKDKP